MLRLPADNRSGLPISIYDCGSLTDLKTLDKYNGARLWPNPANDILHIGLQDGGLTENSQVILVNAQGQEVKSYHLAGGTSNFTISTEGLAGLYILIFDGLHSSICRFVID